MQMFLCVIMSFHNNKKEIKNETKRKTAAGS